MGFAFINEASFLRRENEKLLLVIHGYSAYIAYDTLSKLNKNGIVVLGLQGHTSHVLQQLDLCVFGLLKQCFFRACLLDRETRR